MADSGRIAGLFDEPEKKEPTTASVRAGTDVDSRIDVFLNRWHWRGDRAVVRQELSELIAWSRTA